MRSTYIVSYDVRNAKRLRKIFRICSNYGTHLQFSVFECDLSPQERLKMEGELKEILLHSEDQILFIELGPSEGRGERVISALGQPYSKFDAPCYIV